MSDWASVSETVDGVRAKDFEVLARESHHRIGNHLQILASVLALEARMDGRSEVVQALLNVRRRILAIARLNAALGSVKGAGSVNLRTFLGRVREDLQCSFSSDQAADLALDFDIEAMEAPAEKAATLALIINELVTNALKHAVLPHGGGVGVQLTQAPDREWRLTVRDDGLGLPADAFDKPQSQGFDLVRGLVRQLRGVLSVDRPARGAAISVRFH